MRGTEPLEERARSKQIGALRGLMPFIAPYRGWVVAALVAAGVGVRGFTVEPPSLEDLFVALTGEGFDVSG